MYFDISTNIFQVKYQDYFLLIKYTLSTKNILGTQLEKYLFEVKNEDTWFLPVDDILLSLSMDFSTASH